MRPGDVVSLAWAAPLPAKGPKLTGESRPVRFLARRAFDQDDDRSHLSRSDSMPTFSRLGAPRPAAAQVRGRQEKPCPFLALWPPQRPANRGKLRQTFSAT